MTVPDRPKPNIDHQHANTGTSTPKKVPVGSGKSKPLSGAPWNYGTGRKK